MAFCKRMENKLVREFLAQYGISTSYYSVNNMLPKLFEIFTRSAQGVLKRYDKVFQILAIF